MRTPSKHFSRIRASRILLWILLGLCVCLTVARVMSLARPFHAPGWERVAFYDFRLWRAGVERYERTEQLYDTDRPGYFLAGSHALYKYPPTFAAILKLFSGEPQHKVGRIFLITNLLLLVSALGIILAALRPVPIKSAIMALVFVHWLPTWELLHDLRMEPLILLLLSLSFLWLYRDKEWRAGVPIGVAGAFMVYPWAVLGYFALRWRWRLLLAALAGALATLAAAALILPVQLTVRFFTEILPHVGGTSLAYENLSLLAQFGRFGLLVTGNMPTAFDLDGMHPETHSTSRMLYAHLIALALLIIALLFLGRLVLRTFRITRQLPLERWGPVALAAMICLVTLLIPTSWLSYQIMLILPLLVMLAWIPSPRTDPLACIIHDC